MVNNSSKFINYTIYALSNMNKQNKTYNNDKDATFFYFIFSLLIKKIIT